MLAVISLAGMFHIRISWLLAETNRTNRSRAANRRIPKVPCASSPASGWILFQADRYLGWMAGGVWLSLYRFLVSRKAVPVVFLIHSCDDSPFQYLL